MTPSSTPNPSGVLVLIREIPRVTLPLSTDGWLQSVQENVRTQKCGLDGTGISLPFSTSFVLAKTWTKPLPGTTTPNSARRDLNALAICARSRIKSALSRKLSPDAC